MDPPQPIDSARNNSLIRCWRRLSDRWRGRTPPRPDPACERTKNRPGRHHDEQRPQIGIGSGGGAWGHSSRGPLHRRWSVRHRAKTGGVGYTRIEPMQFSFQVREQHFGRPTDGLSLPPEHRMPLRHENSLQVACRSCGARVVVRQAEKDHLYACPKCGERIQVRVREFVPSDETPHPIEVLESESAALDLPSGVLVCEAVTEDDGEEYHLAPPIDLPPAAASPGAAAVERPLHRRGPVGRGCRDFPWCRACSTSSFTRKSGAGWR